MIQARADEAVLLEIKEVLATFSTSTRDTVAQIEAEINRILDMVKEVVNSLQANVERCLFTLRTAQEEYQSCLNNMQDKTFSQTSTPFQFSRSDPSQFDKFNKPLFHNSENRAQSDCGGYHLSVQIAEDGASIAKDNLDRALKIKADVEKYIEDYNRHKEKLKTLVTEKANSANTFLARKIRDIIDYDRVDPPDMSQETTSHDGQFDDDIPSDKDLEATHPQTISNALTYNLPDSGDMEDLSDSEKEDMILKKDAHRKLQKMLPAIQSGEGANPEYWRSMDDKLGLTHPKGYQRVYDAFYGSEGSDPEKTK